MSSGDTVIVECSLGQIATGVFGVARYYDAIPWNRTGRSFSTLRAALDYLEDQDGVVDAAKAFVKQVIEGDLRQKELAPELLHAVAKQVAAVIPRVMHWECKCADEATKLLCVHADYCAELVAREAA